MDPVVHYYVTLIVTGASVCFALAAGLWAWRVRAAAPARAESGTGRDRKLEARHACLSAAFNAHPGLAMIWDETDTGPAASWGDPALYGAPAALASLLAFAGTEDGGRPATALLEGLADFEARDAAGAETTLRRALKALREDGKPFSLTVTGPSGRFLEADGRTAGAQAVLWLSDSTIRGIDKSQALGRAEAARRTLGDAPESWLEALDKLPLPVWRIAPDGALAWANQAYLAAVEADDLDTALDENRMLHPDLPALARQAVETGEPVDKARRVAIAGERRILGVSLYPVKGGAAGVAIDATGEQAAKEALQRHVQAHDETLDHMAEAVAIFGPSRRLSFYNRAFAEMFGLDESWLDSEPGHGELLDRMREKRSLPEQPDYAEWKAGELKLYEEIPEETPEELWPLPDGRTLRVVRQRHPLGGLLTLFDNVTQEVALRAQYKTALTVRRATLDNLMEGVAVFGSDGRLRLRNAAFERIWNIRESDLAEDAHFDEVVELLRPLYGNNKVWEEIKARVTDPSPESRIGEMGEMERTDGSTLNWISQPLPDGATVVAWADITAVKREEKILRQHNLALQEADRQKTDFVKHVSYQLRTPLTTISGYSELLGAQLAEQLTERQGEYLKAIDAASGQLEKLINDILDIAAIDAGAMELDLGDVRLREVMEQTLEIVDSRAIEARVKLEMETRGELGAIRADETRIKQILYNLLTNAIRHTPEGGVVTLGAEREGGVARLWVTDTGTGLPPESQATVFDRFTSGKRGGAGLGLALVRDFIELHGGWVEFASEEGKGATVTCWLPEEASETAAHPEFAFSGKDAE